METLITIQDREADLEYCSRLRGSPQVIADTEHQWRNTRPLLLSKMFAGRGRALEFGCAFGATAVMLAGMGWDVIGVDISEKRIELSRLNAARYGVKADFRWVADTRSLPFPNSLFSMVSANSVLEYVTSEYLPGVLAELDRVLAPGGILLVAGTSNRLMPREVHSHRWFVNYLPTARWQQGLWPWQIKQAFPRYRDLLHGNNELLEARKAAGIKGWRLGVLSLLNRAAHLTGTSLGMYLPSICLVLQKPK